MIEIKAFGKIENGGFFPRNPKVYMQQIKDAGNVKDCILTITGSNKRSPDQNDYLWAMCEQIKVALHGYGWVEFTSDDVYRRIEERYCYTITVNEKDEQKTIRYLKPLRTQPSDRFWEITEQARLYYMEKLDIYIKLPHEFYGLTVEAYDLWKQNVISFAEAKKQSKKAFAT